MADDEEKSVEEWLAQAEGCGAAGQFGEQVEILERCLELAESAEEMKGLLARIAEIRETALCDPEGAAECWQRVLQIDPAVPRALDAMERICERTERWSELADVLRARIEVETDAGRRVAPTIRLAELHEVRLLDLGEAQRCYEAVLEVAPANEDALRGLERLYAAGAIPRLR